MFGAERRLGEHTPGAGHTPGLGAVHRPAAMHRAGAGHMLVAGHTLLRLLAALLPVERLPEVERTLVRAGFGARWR